MLGGPLLQQLGPPLPLRSRRPDPNRLHIPDATLLLTRRDTPVLGGPRVCGRPFPSLVGSWALELVLVPVPERLTNRGSGRRI